MGYLWWFVEASSGWGARVTYGRAGWGRGSPGRGGRRDGSGARDGRGRGLAGGWRDGPNGLGRAIPWLRPCEPGAGRVPLGQLAVNDRVRVYPLLRPAGDLAGDPGRDSDRDHAVGNDHPRRHGGTRRDQGAAADDDAVQDRGAVAHQRLGADDRAVHHAQVADRGALADLGHRVIAAVPHRTVLDVRAVPDDDRAEVGAEHGAVPDAGFGLDPHVPDQGGGGGDPGPGADLRLTAFEGE